MTQLRGNIGAPGTNASANGGKVYAYNNIADPAVVPTPVRVAATNPQRQSIIFHNPGANDIAIFPQYVQTTGSDVALSPGVSALGGCFRVFGNGGSLTISGECNQAWYAFSFTGSGSTNPLTVMESNT
jgi:hypothetical protein